MLILLSRSHCTICPLTTMTISRVCTDGNCWQWATFTVGPNGQNQHFAGLRQKVCLYIHAVVLLRGLPSLEGKNELFVGKKRKKLLAKSSQTDYNRLSSYQNYFQYQTCINLTFKNFHFFFIISHYFQIIFSKQGTGKNLNNVCLNMLLRPFLFSSVRTRMPVLWVYDMEGFCTPLKSPKS